jgi:histidine phosphotransfer protein HptB
MERVIVEVEAELGDLVPGFLERKREEARKVVEAAAVADFGVVGALGHKLKGEGGSYGFDRLSEIGAALEQAAMNRDAVGMRYLTRRLFAYLQSVEIVVAPQAGE